MKKPNIGAVLGVLLSTMFSALSSQASVSATQGEVVRSPFSTEIQALISATTAAPPAREAAGLTALANDLPIYQIDGEPYLAVDILTAPFETALVNLVATLGAKNMAHYGRIISATVPVAALPQLANLPGLLFVRVPHGQSSTGNVTSQGDFTLNAPRVRFPLTEPGVSGSGVDVGLLSTSFNCLGGMAKDQNDGVLPTIQLLDEAPHCNFGISTDEGRAMAQLIYDVAPGINSIVYRTAFEGMGTFAKHIGFLVEDGVDIIVDDIFYKNSPFFADGPIAQAANKAVASGVPYFSAAGNDGRQSYEAAFVEFVHPETQVRFHDFNNDEGTNGLDVLILGEPLQQIIIPVGRTIEIWFQWDDAYAATGDFSPGAATNVDFNLVELDRQGSGQTRVILSSKDDNIGADPIEFIKFTNDDYYGDGRTDFYLAVVIREGPTPRRFKWIDFGDAEFVDASRGLQHVSAVRPYTDSSTIFAHRNVASVFTVGANDYRHSPNCAVGDQSFVAQPYSAAGNTTIYRAADGRRISQTRDKPDAVGPDNGNTTFFGEDVPDLDQGADCADTDALPNFSGTSAAAPHIAGVAALMKEAFPLISPAETYAFLKQSAVPTFDSVEVAGAGFVQADAAVALVMAAVPKITSPADGSRLSGALQRFEWQTNLEGINAWQVLIGSTRGGNDIAEPGIARADARFFDADSLPTDGREVFVRLRYRIGSEWGSVDASYESSETPAITSPVAGSALDGASQPFTWAANGFDVIEWWIHVGSSENASDIVNTGSLGARTSVTLSGLPTDGRTLFFTLFYRVGADWLSTQSTYTAVSGVGGTPAISSPGALSTLAGATQRFTWAANGTDVTEWWIYIGNSPVSSDIANTGSLGTATATTISGLPTDGRTLHFTLWYKVNGGWQTTQSTYTAASGGGGAPTISSPRAGNVLAGSSQRFTWSANGANVSEWWVYIGNAPATSDLVNSGSLADRTTFDTFGLPTDGRTLHFTLFYRVNGDWLHSRFTYLAASQGGSTPAFSSPRAGSTLNGSAQNFSWAANGTNVSEWWIYIGNAPLTGDIVNTNSLGTLTSANFNSLPTDGRTLHFTLFYRVNGDWLHAQSTYRAAGG